MPDLDQSGNADDASVETPVEQPAPSPDLDAIVQRLAAENDRRFQGFQSMFDRKLAEMSRTMSTQLKTAGLSQEEREQLEQESEAEETQRLRQEVSLLRMRKERPDAVDFFQEVMGAETLEEQLAVIEARLGSKAAAQVEEAVAEAAGDAAGTPEIDRNNPARPASAGVRTAANATEMTDELADAVLASGSKGILNRLRRSQAGAE